MQLKISQRVTQYQLEMKKLLAQNSTRKVSAGLGHFVIITCGNVLRKAFFPVVIFRT